MSRSSIAAAESLFGALPAALQAAAAPHAQARAFLDRLVNAMRTAQLALNPDAPATIEPRAEWQSIFTADGRWRHDPLLAALRKLGPLCRWFRADRFYPAPEYRHFSQAVWGALIAGQQDAIVSTADAFIALLIVIAPRTQYPLHAHRIEEAYYMLHGTGDWSHDGKVWHELAPGAVFHNHSWQAHSMRSGEQPLMALGLYLPPFGWEGGLL